ncbi:MAG: hypothetical protein WC586_06280 [Methanoregula sp.]
MPGQKTILFIYNTDSAVIRAPRDYTAGAAMLPPETCPLVTITHSPLGIKKEWKRFVRDLKTPSRFLDRIEFAREFKVPPVAFPAVLILEDARLSVLISAEELRQCRDLSDLILLIKQRCP